MKCNPDDYRKDIACFNMSKEKEDELILTLWEIMRMFVEMSYGVSAINSIFPTIFEKADLDSGKLLQQVYNQTSNPELTEE